MYPVPRRRGRLFTGGCALVLAGSSVIFLDAGKSHAGSTVCLGKSATIVGTDGFDVLVGTEGADVIAGLGAKDVIRGLGGNDRICGGSGGDELFGGEGNDRLAGQGNPTPDGEPAFPSGDLLGGGKGDDVLYGGSPSTDCGYGDAVTFRGADRGVEVDLRAGASSGQGADMLAGLEGIIGTAHSDTLRATKGGQVQAGNGNDRLISVSGPEALFGGGGQDRLVLGRADRGEGGAGADVLRSRAAGDATAEGGAGDDTFVGAAGPDTFYDLDVDESGHDVATGGGGSDIIALGGGDDTSIGGAGPDVVMAGPGADRVDGGKGRDTFSGGLLHEDGFTVNLRLGTATGGGTGAVGDRVVSIVHLDGSADDDLLIGDGHGNVIFAGPGDDYLQGGAGNDDLDGHVDSDRADGGPGSDTCAAESKDRCEL